MGHSGTTDQVTVRIGFDCNNNCRFCSQANDRSLGNKSLDDAKQDLGQARKSSDRLVLAGGEVTIRPDFLEILKFAKDIGFANIRIESNGRMFSSLELCRRTISAGATEFGLALHGYCPEQHDFLTRAPGSFVQTVDGIRNLKSLGACVCSKTVVSKPNYEDIPRIADLLVKRQVDALQLVFVRPVGGACSDLENMVPMLSLAAPFIHEGLEIGIRAGATVIVRGIPYCFMVGYDENVALCTGQAPSMAKFPQCRYCKYDVVCEGTWREYPIERGSVECQPVILRLPQGRLERIREQIRTEDAVFREKHQDICGKLEKTGTPYTLDHYACALWYLLENTPRASKILEVGSFAGRFVNLLRSKGYERVLGIDIWKYVSKLANRLGSKTALMDINDNSLESGSFDLILCVNLFHNDSGMDERELYMGFMETFRSVHELLKEEGLLYIKAACPLPMDEIRQTGLHLKETISINDKDWSFVFVKDSSALNPGRHPSHTQPT